MATVAARFFSPLCALMLAPLLLGHHQPHQGVHRRPPRRRRCCSRIATSAKCLRRGAVYGEVTGWVFRLGPVVNLATLLGRAHRRAVRRHRGAASSFAGDLIVLVGLLALGRFATVLAALDTGSSFEGMGASREVHFAALAEPALLLGAWRPWRGSPAALSLTPVYGAI